MADASGVVPHSDIWIDPAFSTDLAELAAEIVVLTFIGNDAVNRDEIQPKPCSDRNAFRDIRRGDRFKSINDR